MSTVRMLVLGSILKKGINHGYGVYSDITSWRADTWTSVKPGSIYHALEKLESQGMTQAVETDDKIKLGPTRTTEFAVTPAGKAEFESLLEAVLKSTDIQLFSAGIAFMHMISRTKVITLLHERLHSLEQSVNFLKTLPTEPIPSDPSKHPELVGIWVSYVQNQHNYTKTMLEHIQAGQYAFETNS